MEKKKRPRISILKESALLNYSTKLVKPNTDAYSELQTKHNFIEKTTMFGLVKTKYYKQIY